MSGSSQATSPVEDSRTAPPSVPPPAAPLGSHGSMSSMASIGSLGSTTALAGDVTTSDSHHQLQRRDSQGFSLYLFFLSLCYAKSGLLMQRLVFTWLACLQHPNRARSAVRHRSVEDKRNHRRYHPEYRFIVRVVSLRIKEKTRRIR